MLFQYYGFRAGGFRDILYYLQQWGVIDVFLPFLLIFTILFAVLQKVQLFGREGRRFNVAISIGMSLLVIIPHIMGTYPPGKDIVNIINTSIPEVAFLFIAVVMLLLMLGLIKGRQITGGYVGTTVTVIAAIIIVLIFLSAISPIPIISQIDPALQSLIVIFLIFGMIVYFVGRTERTDRVAWETAHPFEHRWWGRPPRTEGGPPGED